MNTAEGNADMREAGRLEGLEARALRRQSECEALSCFCVSRSHYVAQAGPELQRSHPSLLRAGIIACAAMSGVGCNAA